jgi:hypothetical protein
MTTFQHPSDFTVEIRPSRSMDLQLLLLQEFDVQGFGGADSYFLPRLVSTRLTIAQI